MTEKNDPTFIAVNLSNILASLFKGRYLLTYFVDTVLLNAVLLCFYCGSSALIYVT